MPRSQSAAAALAAVFASSTLLIGCAPQQAAAPPPATAPVQTAATAKSSPTLAGDAAHPGATLGWVRTELYFGLGLADQPEQGIGEAEWRDFLDKEVTPRFPAGLSVEDVYGQWLSKGQTVPSRLRSKVLIILYQGNPENAASIEAIRSAWKQKTGHQSVLRVTQPADVSF